MEFAERARVNWKREKVTPQSRLSITSGIETPRITNQFPSFQFYIGTLKADSNPSWIQFKLENCFIKKKCSDEDTITVYNGASLENTEHPTYAVLLFYKIWLHNWNFFPERSRQLDEGNDLRTVEKHDGRCVRLLSCSWHCERSSMKKAMQSLLPLRLHLDQSGCNVRLARSCMAFLDSDITTGYANIACRRVLITRVLISMRINGAQDANKNADKMVKNAERNANKIAIL